MEPVDAHVHMNGWMAGKARRDEAEHEVQSGRFQRTPSGNGKRRNRSGRPAMQRPESLSAAGAGAAFSTQLAINNIALIEHKASQILCTIMVYI